MLLLSVIPDRPKFSWLTAIDFVSPVRAVGNDVANLLRVQAKFFAVSVSALHLCAVWTWAIIFIFALGTIPTSVTDLGLLIDTSLSKSKLTHTPCPQNLRNYIG